MGRIIFGGNFFNACRSHVPIRQSIRLTVDAVVFGYADRTLQLLLIQRKAEPFAGRWALPGGFVRDEESLEAAATRELEEETGARVAYLEQLYTFGAPARDPRGRTVSVAYFGLVAPAAYNLVAATDAADARWFSAGALPALAFDHKAIVATALCRLRAKLGYEPIGFELLPKAFPFSELETLYTAVLGAEIDRRNFRKKVLQLGFVEEVAGAQTTGRGRPAQLYRFSKARYEALRKEGRHLDLL